MAIPAAYGPLRYTACSAIPMNDLQWYLVRHYAHLFSDYEKSAIKRMNVDAKIRSGYSGGAADVLEERYPWTDGDPDSLSQALSEYVPTGFDVVLELSGATPAIEAGLKQSACALRLRSAVFPRTARHDCEPPSLSRR